MHRMILSATLLTSLLTPALAQASQCPNLAYESSNIVVEVTPPLPCLQIVLQDYVGCQNPQIELTAGCGETVTMIEPPFARCDGEQCTEVPNQTTAVVGLNEQDYADGKPQQLIVSLGGIEHNVEMSYDVELIHSEDVSDCSISSVGSGSGDSGGAMMALVGLLGLCSLRRRRQAG